jgi:hypothetical protein
MSEPGPLAGYPDPLLILTAAAETTSLTVVLDIHSNMQRVKAQVDCGAMSICIWPSLFRKLVIPYEPAFTSTLV